VGAHRQANGTAFYRRSADGDRAIELAYGDVRRAFEAFNARRGGARPFIIAAHSQGSVLAERLLYEAVSGTPLRERLVAAYLPGGGVTTAGLRERAPDLAPCRAADDLRCVAAWDARGPGFAPTRFDVRRADTRERLCTNPLTWTTDGARASESLNLGAVFMETDDHAPRAPASPSEGSTRPRRGPRPRPPRGAPAHARSPRPHRREATSATSNPNGRDFRSSLGRGTTRGEARG
jgi:hypothetical protein